MEGTREFSLGAMLSIVQRRMIAPAGTPEILSLICHIVIGPDPSVGEYVITQEDVDRCGEELLRQHRWLACMPRRSGADFHHVSLGDWVRLDQLERRVGASHPVKTAAIP